ncbi:general secretion pathway protein J [marine gamma proteobacterium HTCC2143]|jgi:general secretion pathway protein J|uniref:Type II secretion system protein J n=1 Tax=marine gamma proteobacterium HTCC2143 TaxID=247633 RepID=A0YG39_9GAMM|nr:general secretion pathway protein J [marine gamma proteobacterium HTCC2143]
MDDEMAANKPIAGFTLIEVLLAMGITTFVALLAYSGLSASITAAESQQLQAQQIVDIQLPLTVLERDIRNAVARPIRDEYDDRVEALVGGAFNDYLLVLTRRGWDNPRELSRGELQRVRYQLLDDVLWRESWSVLDRVSEEAGRQRTRLLQGVRGVEIAFLDSASSDASRSPLGGEWLDEWDIPQRLPAAIKIQFDVEGFGEVARVISIPSL